MSTTRSKSAPSQVLRAITGGRTGSGRTLVLTVRAFDDPTVAMQESVEASDQRPDR